jgi:hypothetical protein
MLANFEMRQIVQLISQIGLERAIVNDEMYTSINLHTVVSLVTEIQTANFEIS